MIRKNLLVLALLLCTGRVWAAGCNGTGDCYFNRAAVGCGGNTNDVLCWVTTDGGSVGGGLPATTDNVHFTASSGSGTATVNAALACNAFDASASSVTIAGSSALTVTGDMSLPTVTSLWTNTSAVSFTGTTKQTLTSNANTIGAITINNPGGYLLQADALTGSTILITAGGWDTGNDTSGGDTGGFNVTLTSTASDIISSNNSNTRKIYWNASLVKIIHNGSANGARKVLLDTTTGLTWDPGHSTLEFNITSSSSTGNTSVQLTNATSGTSSSGTVRGLYDVKWSGSSAIGFQCCTTASSFSGIHDLTITTTGGGTMGRCTSVTGAFNTTGATVTILCSTGDAGTFTGNVTLGGGGGTTTVTATRSWTLVNTSGTQNFTTNGTSLSTLTSLIRNGTGGTTQLQDALTVSLVTLTNGTFDTNGQNVTGKLGTVSGTKTLTLGTTTWNCNASGTCWDAQTAAANFTITSAPSSVIKCTNASGCTFAGGAKTWGQFYCATASATGCTIQQANTFASLKLDISSKLILTASTTTTLTGGITSLGTSASHASIISSNGGTKATLSQSSGAVRAGFTDITDSTATGGATFCTSGTLSNTTGWTAPCGGGGFFDAP